MKIDNVKIYDMTESILASALPMTQSYDEVIFERKTESFHSGPEETQTDLKRAYTLADNPANSGHCNFLKGVLVSANITGTIKWWEQFQRYHFVTIVSSMSTMHKITAMNFSSCVSDKVLPETVECCKNLVNKYKNGEVDFDTLIDNVPLGLNLTARVQTNYLQLRTIWNQRKGHKYHEWGPFCAWIESLPGASDFITVE